MFRSGAALGAAYLACACTHGYGVTLHVNSIRTVDAQVVDSLVQVAQAHDLQPKVAALRGRDDVLSSLFLKQVSADERDEIRMDVVYSDEQSRRMTLSVFISDVFGGERPEVKQQIDSIGDTCRAILERSFGASSIEDRRGPWSTGWFR